MTLLDAAGNPLPPTRGTRRFDGAGGGVRWQNAPSFGPIVPEVAAAAMPLRRRSSYYSRNNPWLGNAVSALVSGAIGYGIRPSPQHPTPAVRELLGQLFERWQRRADADGVTDFYGMQGLAVRTMIEQGEAFGVMQNGPGGALRLRLLDPEMVDEARTVELRDGARIINGVEFDALGNRVAYHILRRRPADLFAGYGAPIRVSADDVVHLFMPLAPGQVRGIAWTATVLARLHEFDQLEDAHLMGQKVTAMFAGFLTDVNGTGGQATFDGQQAGSVLTSGLEPGTLKVLPPGTDIKFSTPREAKDSIDFLKLQLRAIAAGLGVPDYLVSGDLSEANYSSLRAGLVEFRRRIEALQHTIIIHQFCRPIWERFILSAVLSGTLAAPDFEARMDDYFACEWHPPAQDWVDPAKDVAAETAAIAAGLKSRRQAVAERGYDIEALDREIAADRQREAAAGLRFSTTTTTERTPDA